MISTTNTTNNPSSQTLIHKSPQQPHNAFSSEVINTCAAVSATTTPNLSSRIIPTIGSLVKRFSLNYSGEGLVSDPQRTRTVRVGIRFQVQVDSFSNNSSNSPRAPNGNPQIRPKGITRTHSLDYIHSANNRGVCATNNSSNSVSSVSDSSCDSTNSYNNRQFVIERSPGTSPVLHRNFASVGNFKDNNTLSGSSDLEFDSSSGVSSLGGSNPTSPVNSRRHSSSLAFHNRINQALNLCRNQLTVAGDPDHSRRSSVQVYRRGSNPHTPEQRSPISTSPIRRVSTMEDASSYQILRCFPGLYDTLLS